jgi:hypothetical protein
MYISQRHMGNSFAVQASQELCSMELLGNHEMQFIYTVRVLRQKLSITLVYKMLDVFCHTRKIK